MSHDDSTGSQAWTKEGLQHDLGDQQAASKRRRLASPPASASSSAALPVADDIFDDASDGCPTPPREDEDVILQSAWTAAAATSIDVSLRAPQPPVPHFHVEELGRESLAGPSAFHYTQSVSSFPAFESALTSTGGGQHSNSTRDLTEPAAAVPSGKDDLHALQYDATKIPAGTEGAYYDEALVRFIARRAVLRRYALGSTFTGSTKDDLQIFCTLTKRSNPKDLRRKIKEMHKKYDRFRQSISSNSQAAPISAWGPADMDILANFERSSRTRSKWIRPWHDTFYAEWPAASTAAPTTASSSSHGGPALPAGLGATSLRHSSSSGAAAFGSSPPASASLITQTATLSGASLPFSSSAASSAAPTAHASA